MGERTQELRNPRFLGNEDEKFMRFRRVSHHRPRGMGSGKRGQQELGNTIYVSSGYEDGEFMMNPWVSS